MSNTALNDAKYSIKPLEAFVPSKNDKVDENDLQKSVKKSKEIFSRLDEKKSRNN